MSDRSEHEIRESIEATRARMGETIEQIGDRVNPERVKAEMKARAKEQMHEVKDNMKRKARNTMRDVEHGVTDTGRGIWATIKDNPVPAGMVGVGLAWLFANRREGSSYDRDWETYSTGPAVPYRSGYTGNRYDQPRSTGTYGYTAGTTPGYAAGSVQHTHDGSNGEGLRDRAAHVASDASEKLGDVQERVGEAVHDTQERVSSAVHHTQERAGELVDRARMRAQRAERRIEESLQENPMAVGAVALALGMAAGLLIPETDREHELMGRSRDRVLDRAQDATRRAAEKVHDSVRDAAGESARHAVDEVWPIGEDRQAEGFSEPRR